MIWKLLRHNISAWQIAGYASASLVGLVIVLVAMQFYRDVSGALAGDGDEGTGLISSRNIVISKPVSLSATLTGEGPSFSGAEIAEIASQPWASGVGRFQAADFGVRAGVEIGGRGMHTALFLESVPDSLLDIDSRLWKFDENSPSVPIVISKDYLALYNFGFASSGNMPMLSEGMISSVPLQITLSGNGRMVTLPGRIVGFSSWLNTVAVPQKFMDWAHAQFGAPEVAEPSRLVVTVSDPSDPGIDRFLSERGYETAGGAGDLGRAAYFLRLLTSVIVGVGAVITILAIGILILSIFLLVQKNRRTISGLLLLGYSPPQVASCYINLVAAVNAAVWLLACAAVFLISRLWEAPLAGIEIASSAVWPTLAVGAAIMGAITLLNILVIKQSIRFN